MAEASRGRFWREEESPTRTCYQRDRDRLIHSAAFRRLKHKTQVFVQHEGDYYRTRLTHSLEVAQIARALARRLGLDEDLAEALALSHDFGHPPFGHAGEAALDECMRAFGGFDHNAQALSLVTRLEHRYAEFDGLNLTWETLEGLVKHNGPLLKAGESATALPQAIAQFEWDLELSSHAGPEAQVAALSDDIAYINHDIDDGLRAGLFSVGDLYEVRLAGPIFDRVTRAHPQIEIGRVIGEAIRDLIGRMVADVAAETQRRLEAAAPKTAADIRALAAPAVAFSESLRPDLLELRGFLHRRMYRHPRVMEVMEAAQKMLTQLFAAYMNDPHLMPPEWSEGCGVSEAHTARLVCDYIAGMTDGFAQQEQQRIFHTEFRL
jgi:dGTPase